MSRRTLARIAAALGLVGTAAWAVRQRQLAANAKRFGLPI